MAYFGAHGPPQGGKLASNRQYYGERDHHGESMTNQELDHQRSSSGIPPLAATPVPAALAVALVVVLGGTAYTATLTAVGGLPAATVAPVLAALVVAALALIHTARSPAPAEEGVGPVARALSPHRPIGWRAERQARIRQVIAAGDVLTTVLQPIVDLNDGHRVGAEALARFGGRERRSPDVIFGEALAVGLGVELELAALETGLTALGHLPPGSYLSLNVSPSTVLSARLAQVLDGAEAARIVLELTEHAEVADYDVLTRALDTLRRRGVRLAVDDAGAGFASLRHIVRLSPDFIKLDVSLTRGIDIDPVRQSLAAALASFARDTGPVVVAEGIETEAELEALRHLGVPLGQGFHLGRPMPVAAVDLREPSGLSRLG